MWEPRSGPDTLPKHYCGARDEFLLRVTFQFLINLHYPAPPALNIPVLDPAPPTALPASTLPRPARGGGGPPSTRPLPCPDRLLTCPLPVLYPASPRLLPGAARPLPALYPPSTPPRPLPTRPARPITCLVPSSAPPPPALYPSSTLPRPPPIYIYIQNVEAG